MILFNGIYKGWISIEKNMGNIQEWFYTHATSSVGPKFCIPFGNNVSKPLKPGWNMNIDLRKRNLFFQMPLLILKN